MNTNMEMTTEEKPVLPDVLSYCLENKKFRERWQDIYKSADEHIRDTRLCCKELFDSDNWKNGKQYVIEYDETDPQKEAAYKSMFNMIKKHFTSLERTEADKTQRLSQRVVYDSIRDNYEKNPKPFISSMCRFLEEEERLLNQFVASEAKAMEVCSDDQDAILRYMEECSKNVNIYIHELEAVEDELNKKLGFGQYPDGNTGPSAPEEQNRHIQTKLLDNLKSYLQEIVNQAVEAEAILARKMLNFKKQLQFFYVDLENQKPIIPAEVERGYSWMGQILYNILQYALPKLECLAGADMVQSTSCNLKQCFERLLHGSFVVIEQQKHIIKVELGSKKRNKDADATGEEAANQKFRCPKFSANVRLLACDNIDCKGKVKAQFCNEAEVNEKFNSGDWDSPCQIKLKAKTDESTFEKKAIATFKKMEIEKFERKPDVQVCEDKFRIVFTTKVKVADQEILVATISLPIVVTTGASQSCNVHGSLLWQCFSIQDAFHLPIETINSLRWHTVFEMLNKKILTLGGRDLCTDEKDHLGSRLMLEDNPIPDEMDIPFRRFCVDKMMDIQEGDDKKKSATFWMWFLAVFNLTKSHLRDYWNDGLIAGFIKKGTAEQRLKKMQQPHVYTYLLRFSDKVITDGQGQNLCGAISATVLYKNQKELWKCFPTEPFKADKFKKMSLAQLVKNTCICVEIKVHLLQWLYNTSLSSNEKKSFAQCVENTGIPGKINVHLLQWLYRTPTLSTRTDDAFKLDNAESRRRGENPYKKFEEYMRFEGNLIVSLSDLSLDEDAYPESKRDIKKAVGPSKKREATKGRSGVIKNRRLSESQQEPNMHSDALCSPFSLPQNSPQMQAIPDTVLEFSGDESQDSMGSQPPQTTTLNQRMPYMPNSQQVSIDQSFSTSQPNSMDESLSSIQPTLSRMLSSSYVDSFQTINENDLSNSCFSEVSPAPSMFSLQQPSPANSVNSLQSPDHNTKSVTMTSTVYAPATRESPDIAVQSSQSKLAQIDEQMSLFEKLKSKLRGGSSESSVSSSSEPHGFSPQVAATLQSPEHTVSPLAASPAWSIQTDSLQSPFSQSSSAGSVVSTIVEPMMESVEAILNDPDHTRELIENLKCVFNEINSSLRSRDSV